MKNDELAPEDEEEDEDFKNIGLSLPKMSINIRSSDLMEVTVTKTCLEVLNNLAKVGSRGFNCGFKIGEACRETPCNKM